MGDGPSNDRKLDHIEFARKQMVVDGIAAGWEGIRLMPVALPAIRVDDVRLQTTFLNHTLRAPIMIAGMTGGHPETLSINRNLATAAQECGIAMGVGSQRAALEDPDLAPTYSVTRKHAPDAFICGNIGISQIANGMFDEARTHAAIDMVEANAIAVHINVLQELIQPEGAIDLERALPTLAKFVDRCPVPVIVKETGCGLDRKTARRLADIGVDAIDVGGAGGTSFVTIEGARAEQMNEHRKARLARTFQSWGLSTVESLTQVRGLDIPVIGTGGIRNGLDVAKALSIGADMVGVGRQMLEAALAGPDEAVAELKLIILELKIAMALSECLTLSDLKAVDIVGR